MRVERRAKALFKQVSKRPFPHLNHPGDVSIAKVLPFLTMRTRLSPPAHPPIHPPIYTCPSRPFSRVRHPQPPQVIPQTADSPTPHPVTPNRESQNMHPPPFIPLTPHIHSRRPNKYPVARSKKQEIKQKRPDAPPIRKENSAQKTDRLGRGEAIAAKLRA